MSLKEEVAELRAKVKAGKLTDIEQTQSICQLLNCGMQDTGELLVLMLAWPEAEPDSVLFPVGGTDEWLNRKYRWGKDEWGMKRRRLLDYLYNELHKEPS